MDVLINLGWMVLGLTLLYFGAEWLVRGSSELALRLGITPLVVGLTVVAFGTSAPELLVGIQANLKDPPQGDIALGNVIGSNIFNIALILGAAALMRPIVINSQIIKREMPILILATAAFLLMVWDGEISRVEGGVLTIGIISYVLFSIVSARHSRRPHQFEEFEKEQIEHASEKGLKRVVIDIVLIIVGLLALSFGADRLVMSGMELARLFGVPEAIIALTFFAFGTSVPELATSVVASLKNQGDIITGNVVGSCIFNLLAVIGITGLVAPLSTSEIRQEDLWVMGGISVLLIPFMGYKMRLSRIEGGIFLASCFGYVFYLAVRSGVV